MATEILDGEIGAEYETGELTLGYAKLDEGTGLAYIDPNGGTLSYDDLLVLAVQVISTTLDKAPESYTAGVLDKLNQVLGHVLHEHGLQENEDLVLAELVASDILMKLSVDAKKPMSELARLSRDGVLELIAANYYNGMED